MSLSDTSAGLGPRTGTRCMRDNSPHSDRIRTMGFVFMNAMQIDRPGGHQVFRLPQVCAVTGLCRSMVYQLEAQSRFPRRIKIGLRAVGWLEADIQAWISTRIRQSRR
jgi:prophage regulatory protein